MRLAKMLGLAMVAAIAVTAFIGAGTASATLCLKKESPCSAANTLSPNVTILTHTTEATLKGFATVTCLSHVTIVEENDTSGLTGSISLLDWSNCTGCTEVTTTTPGTFDAKATGSGNGELLPLNTVVLLKKCPLGAECTASAINGTTALGLDGGTIKGTALGLASTTVKLSGFGCGSTGTWTATKPYEVQSVNGNTSGEIFVE